MQLKTCTKCHIEKQLTEFSKRKASSDGLSFTCKSCNKQYAQENKERIDGYYKQYYQNNAKQIAEQRKQYQQDNQEHLTEYRKLWQQNNKEYIAEQQNQYRQTPKGKAGIKADNNNRRAAKLNNGGKHTSTDILNLFELQSGKCPYCKAKLCKTKRNSFHIDHVIPLSKSGSNDISNIQLLCPKCNMSKKDKLPEEFAANFNKLF